MDLGDALVMGGVASGAAVTHSLGGWAMAGSMLLGGVAFPFAARMYFHMRQK